MSQHLQAIATLFSLVNPLVCALMFASIARGQSRGAALRSATGAMLTVAAVLVMAAFAGAPLLKLFGISLDAFSVAGGGVLIFIGLSMMKGDGTPAASADPGASPDIGKLVLFAASPGTITGVMTLTAAHRGTSLPVTALVAIAVVLSVTWILLVAKSRRPLPEHQGLAHDMVSRYMGLIIIAMGIQFALTGFRSFMSGG
ncbi:MarC family protein [Tropicimonas sp. IMCC6043]|uniref:MarC family protein n=1 Tax=Tropicimonas sp. IMCC6043 TaxID=2510645 RepID=UPI00101C6247|nr:MarC family protein [Tropicimonas sp. IMCC6043]RYH10683.1 MarC family protein [Tropicimonas sp. IMCC6043]